ncbi:MAG: hypothetical protein GC179_08830 [Anaerolineaceae bacterium]|nr:hypothetical protein [Anaerolineaceae bacterium]
MTTTNKSTTTVNIQIGTGVFTAKLLDNASSHALMAMLPMTITMIELNNNEKYYDLTKNLPVNAQRVGKINNGDLMLYGSNCLVIFYKSFNTPHSYTRLGSIEDVSELAATLGQGKVEVTFTLTT